MLVRGFRRGVDRRTTDGRPYRFAMTETDFVYSLKGTRFCVSPYADNRQATGFSDVADGDPIGLPFPIGDRPETDLDQAVIRDAGDPFGLFFPGRLLPGFSENGVLRRVARGGKSGGGQAEAKDQGKDQADELFLVLSPFASLLIMGMS